MMEKEKEETLSSLLQSYGSAAVALSGGVDSAVLLMAAVRTLGAFGCGGARGREAMRISCGRSPDDSAGGRPRLARRRKERRAPLLLLQEAPL